MKKLILLGLIIVMCLPILASCVTTLGAGADDNEPKTEQVVEDNVESETEKVVEEENESTKEGARIYQNTIDSMETHFTSTTSLSYISEKIRQSDRADGILVEEFGGMEMHVQVKKEEFESYLNKIANK